MRRLISVGAMALLLAASAAVFPGAQQAKPIVKPAPPVVAPVPGDRAGWMTLAPTPPMGWNSWNKFGCNVSEQLIRETADALVSSGMKDAGYQFVVIDDCWQVSRDANGVIVADPQRFASGMKALADYVHSRGLKFGVYSDAGSKTCQGRPGSNGYEEVDARQYAAWGVDYLKYDWCNTDGVDPKIAYPTMRDALRASGRPIVFSMCEWGRSQPWTWARGVGHLWRTTGDIGPSWQSFARLLDQQVDLWKFAGPGGWNDPDMLEVGNGTLTPAENRAHFSLWCLLAAPLMAGNDIRQMAPEIRDILVNREIVAIDQDPLGAQGRRIRRDDLARGASVEIWAKKLQDGGYAIALLNRSNTNTEPVPMAVSWQEVGLRYDAEPMVRDLWAKKDLGRVKGTFTATVAAHDVVMIRVTP
jgi:alpha-galactosidase